MIDNFTGDGVMAFWGGSDPADSVQECLGAAVALEELTGGLGEVDRISTNR